MYCHSISLRHTGSTYLRLWCLIVLRESSWGTELSCFCNSNSHWDSQYQVRERSHHSTSFHRTLHTFRSWWMHIRRIYTVWGTQFQVNHSHGQMGMAREINRIFLSPRSSYFSRTVCTRLALPSPDRFLGGTLLAQGIHLLCSNQVRQDH